MPSKTPIELTKEQKDAALVYWEKNKNKKLNLKQMAIFVGGPDCTFRSELGLALRKFLIDEKLIVNPTKIGPVEIYELKLAEKEFLDKNRANHSPVELIKVLFANEKNAKDITPYHPKGKAVIEYLRITKENGVEDYVDPNSVATSNYYPPQSPQRVIVKINKSLHNAGFPNCEHMTAKQIEESLKHKQKTCVLALLNYLNDNHFVELMNSYKSVRERNLLESTFIKYVWDKPDLTAEEVEQYVTLSNETVNGLNIQAHINDMQALFNSQVEGESPQVKYALVEHISNARTEYNQVVARKQKLLDALVTKRSKKLEESVSEKASLVTLIEYWKNSEQRATLIKMAEEKRKALTTEANRLKTMDDIVVEIFGLDSNEIINS